MKNTLLPILAVGLVSLAAAQYGPAPPRINIPGAIPLPIVRGVPIREERVLPPQTQILRVRRPNHGGGGSGGGFPSSSIRPHQQIPIQFSTPKFFESEAKPVTEEHEEHHHENSAPFLPIIHSSPAPPPHPSPPPQQHSIPDELDERDIQQNILSRFNSQDNRPAPIPRAQPIPERFFSTEKELSSNAQRFNLAAPEQPQQRPAPVPAPKQYRPAPQQVVQQRPAPARIQQQHYDEDRPTSQRQQAEDDRRKKPVVQILRKWREEHEDGSITWGFENDDGSFKEETIGIDCVTRGSYGYVDPDGEKREYTYETGILCDPNKRDEEEEEEEDELQLKNKVKRPNQQQQGQQQQQQQYYRN
ncbi:probable basic-leucine zipper transcription factor I [Culex quinquefasciatus]|uniref:probable basic-leucine zipper transcription factor I n=1 Tax=Culex quinquefasciatus TaxID=7176 RepID=UPI0018E3A92D|nr:probable basic-leucine zipper transcription factor I [Culex quinquefasciatus]